MNDCEQGLALTERLKETQKWAITLQYYFSVHTILRDSQTSLFPFLYNTQH